MSTEQKGSTNTNGAPALLRQANTFENAEEKESLLHIKSVLLGLFSVKYDASDTIAMVKEKVQNAKGISPDQQRLIFGGNVLSDTATLSGLGIKSGTKIGLVLRNVLGGGRRRKTRRKRKRKTRRRKTKRKRKKRKRKKRKRKTRKRMCKFRK